MDESKGFREKSAAQCQKLQE
jgi:regulator of replication initiation timing